MQRNLSPMFASVLSTLCLFSTVLAIMEAVAA
jgi:hypothetical protein